MNEGTTSISWAGVRSGVVSEIASYLHQNHVFRVRCQQDRLLPDFLALLSAPPYGKRFFVLNSKQSTNLASINSTQLKSFPIPLPSTEEQRRLVGISTKKTQRYGCIRISWPNSKRSKKG